jgi:hypothetical protein
MTNGRHMRSLPSALLAAQKSASAEPYVDVLIENSVRGIRRLDFVPIDATAQPLARHGVAVAGDGSVSLVRIESGAVKQQRVANPATGPWNAWNNLASGMGAQVACAASGSRVAVVYVDAAGTGIKLRESADNGATYGAEVAVTTAASPLTGLAVACKNSGGDLAVVWAAGTSIGIIKRTAGAFGSPVTAAPGVSSINGLAIAYGFDWDIVLTGAEAATLRPSLWTIAYGDGNDLPANTWSALQPQLQAESDAQVTYRAPAITFTDAYRITFVEADAFPGGATRTYRTSLHPALLYVGGPFALRTPVPVDYGGVEGLALAADGGGAGFVYESAPDAVFRAAQSQQLVSVTARVVEAGIEERDGATSGYIDLDNADGSLAGPPAPIALGNLAGISWGYRTASGVQGSRMQDLWIAAIEYRRAGGVSILRLHLEGAWEALRRNAQRAQIVHTSDTYLAILTLIAARAGLLLSSGGVSSRAVQVTPAFTVATGVSGFEAIRRALALLPDRIRARPLATMHVSEPLAPAAGDYTFGTDHPLREVRLLSEPAPVSEAHVFGAGAFGEAIDFTAAAMALGERVQRRDVSSTTGPAAAAAAAAHLRQRALDARAGSIVVAPHCGLELWDVVELSDPLIGPAAIGRVAGIRWRYDRARAMFEQRIELGAM